MTQVAGHPRSDRLQSPRRHDICPFLLADSAWRSAAPAKEHQCLALGADVPLALEKQKRLCLTAEHRGCPAYTTALGLGEAGERAAAPGPPRRPYPRMAPVVIDRGRMSVAMPAVARDRPAGQLALAGLMVVAFAAIALARLGGVGEGGVAAGATSPSPQGSVIAAAPSPTPVPTPEPTPSAAPPSAIPDPSPTPDLRTYKVKRGDTLIRIASRYGTTVKALIDLNDIDDPARIPIGAVLRIPPEAP